MGSQMNTRNNQNIGMYVDGNTVRKVQYGQAVPQRTAAPRRNYEEEYQRARQRKNAVRQLARRRARNRAFQMSLGYVTFLGIAAVATVFICVNYLQLQAQVTTSRKEVARLESQYSELKLNNDAAYSKAVSSVDLDGIRDIAINELGMVYANKDQIITYKVEDTDYVRQYQSVPTE